MDKKNKILICEDDLGIVEMLELVLEDLDIEIITETDSTKLLNMAREIRPDRILMDLWMPLLTGDQLLRKIRVDRSICSVPVLMMSAAQDGKKISMEAGANGYIAKPFNIEHLMTLIEEQLLHSRSQKLSFK